MKSKRKLIRSNWLYWKRNRKQKLWLLIKEKVIDWLVFRPINQISLRNNNRRQKTVFNNYIDWVRMAYKNNLVNNQAITRSYRN